MSDDGPRSRTTPSSPGPEHDAWLREALRHAPDASASPPPSLRESILAEARAAARAGWARPAAAPSLLDRALAFWSWLARPQVAAGFASVMAATLVGMLWWDRPMDEAMLPASSSRTADQARTPAQDAVSVASEKQSPPAAAGKPASQLADPRRESVSPPTTGAEPRPTTPAPAKAAPPSATAETAAKEAARKQPYARATDDARARSAAVAEPAAKTEEAKAARKDDKLQQPPPSMAMAPPTRAAATPTPGTLRPAAEAPSPFPARSPVEADAATRPAPLVAAAPSPTFTPPSVQQVAPEPGRAEPFALAKKAESTEKEGAAAKSRPTAPAAELRAPATGALGGATLDSSEASATGRVAAQNAAGPAARQPAVPAPSPARPMAPLLAALASEETLWSRRLESGESAAVDAALRAWLAQVQSAAARWEASERSARRDAPAASFPTTILRLERGGRAGAVMQIEDGGVLFDPLSGSAWFAPLPPEVVARLRASLPPAPR